MAEERESVLTIDELAEYLKISKSSLYKLVKDGKVPGQKVGAALAVPSRDDRPLAGRGEGEEIGREGRRAPRKSEG